MMRARCARVHNQLLHAFSRSAWVALHVFDVQRAEDSCGIAVAHSAAAVDRRGLLPQSV